MCGNCDIVPAESREVIVQKIESLLVGAKLEFMNVQHYFHNGVYTRSGKITAGEIIIGAKHRAKNVFHISKGKIIVWDEFNGVRTLTAPYSEISKPGIQRIGYALEDVEGCNIFETDKTTVLEVETEMLFPFTVPIGAGDKILKICNENPAVEIS
jgi:hypothetical protein